MADARIDSRRHRDGGFTLVEILIVTVTIAVITAAVATSITVVLRNTPPTEVRANDARSVQGLVTWLPQDIDAAPPDGFDRDPATWPCAGSAPADSYNVVTATWTEVAAVTTTYTTSYRYDKGDTDWTMKRYWCDDAGTGTMGAAQSYNLTSGLPAWSSSSPPAWVEMCKSAVDTGGTCPAADVIPDSITQPNDGNGGGVRSLQLFVTRLDDVVITIDAAPKNPDQDLNDDPYAVINKPPKVSSTNATVSMYAGDTIVVDLSTTHNPVDPDGDPISAALDSTEPIPTGLTVSTSDPLDVTITADPSLAAGTLADPIVLIISDNRAGWVDATLTVEILPTPNDPPTVTDTNYDLKIVPGDEVVLPLDATHGVTDPDGDPLTGTVLTYPVSLTTPPKLDSPGPLDLQVKTPSGAPIGVAGTPITIAISDGVNPAITITVTVEFIAAPPNNAPTATSTTVGVDMYADDTLSMSLDASHGVSDPDGDPLSVVSVSDPAGVTTTLDGGLDITIVTAPGLIDGAISPSIELVVEDIHGAQLTVYVTVDIIPTPPPPSNCELLGLTATPDPVERQANGGEPHLLIDDVTVTLSYSGSCDGLTLSYDSGDTSGLGISGRVFPAGSPTSIVIVSKDNGGTEKWSPGTHTLTATTTSSDAIVGTVTTTLTVT